MLGKASEIKTDTAVRYKISNGMGVVAMSEVVNAWLSKNPNKAVIDIKPSETFALIIYKEESKND